ncbi:MAG TPA: O-antigen ligase family protein [Candidatus Hydrogenedentes bacterium]|nr:O-antigen ligase family protein [Candidatus Hydrogenedentota bacterium]
MRQRRQQNKRAAHTSESPSALSGPAVTPSRHDPPDELAELLTALVLGGIALLRPWQDGMTFPSINNYYLWIQAGLFALVSARMLVRREALRFPLLTALFASFLAMSVLATLGTVQYNNSYRTLLIWGGHFFLFVVASQTLRRPRSIAIVLSGFVAGAFAEAVFSVVHLKYYLPLVRERVQTDPGLVQRYFSAGEINPEIARRLNTNRAFGTFLFPNALAGYMLLCVPFALGAFAYSIQALRTLVRREDTRPARPDAYAAQAAGAGLAAWAISGLVMYIALSFFHAVAYRDDSMRAHWILWALSVGVFPLAAGAGLYLITKRRGLFACWWTVASCVLPAFAVASGIALIYSFSRGGLLAFGAATSFTAALLFVLLRKPGLLPSRWASALLVTLTFAGLAATLDARAAAEPSSEVLREGVNMSIDELANPATMLLRLTYWKTGASIIANDFWTGAGPGNFGVMYPRFKYVGAGETDHAHNDYLQIFAETGIFGAIAFCAFWGAFTWWALRQLLRMRTSPQLWLFAGLFASILAFLLHAAVDFDFVNPGLAGMACLFTGVFCAAAKTPAAGEAATSRYARPVAAVFLACVAVAVGASVRVHRADALAGSEPDFRSRLLAAQFFVFQAPEQIAQDPRAANIPLRDALILVPDLDALRRCGSFWVSEPGKTPRKLGAHEALWINAYLNVTDPIAAREVGIHAAKDAFTMLEGADALFPHDPLRAVQLSAWCDFLAEAAETDGQRLEWSDRSVAWAVEALARSPEEAWLHEQYGAALATRARYQQEPGKRRDDLINSLEQYAQSTVLFPSSPVVWENYAQALRDTGANLRQAGETDQSDALQKQADEAAARAQEIRVAEYHANRRRAGLE